MLKMFSRMERTQKGIILAFALLMAVSLIIFYAPGRNRTAASDDPTRSTEAVARVGGDTVTVGDIAIVKQDMQRRLGGQMTPAQLGYTDKRFLDELIKNRIVAQEAARLHLSASDAELREHLMKQYTDPSTGQFVGMDRYKEIITGNYGDMERYEQGVRDALSAQKLEAFVTAGVRVSDEEVQDQYKRKQTVFELVYVPVTADKLAQKIQPSDQDLRAYYDQHKEEYKYNEPQKKIRYLYIDQTKMGEKLNISDDELRKEFEGLSGEAKQAGVKIQQILLKVARPDLDQQVKEKADALMAKLRAEGNTVSEEKFAELARGNSEDPATAKNGGMLPKPFKRNPNKPDALYDRMVDQQPGTLFSDPIRYGGHWYILRRGEDVSKTFEEAKPELLASLRNRKAYSAAAQLSAKAADELKKNPQDIQKVAQSLAAEANMKPAEMVRETPGYVKPGDDVPNIGSSQQFEGAIAPLNNPNEVGSTTQIKGGFAIPILVDKKEPRIPEFDEVKERVAQTVKLDRAKSQLEQTARELAQNTASAADLKAAAEKLGLEAKTDDGYKLGSPLGQAGTSPAADEVIYALKAGEVAKAPVKIGENWVVIGENKRIEADLAEFAKQREELTQTALAERRNMVFGDYIASVHSRMEQDGKIKIYDDVLNQMSADEEPPAALPRRAPIFPGGAPGGK
jgi:peptidyl-prolyl cis-trans isomerase D